MINLEATVEVSGKIQKLHINKKGDRTVISVYLLFNSLRMTDLSQPEYSVTLSTEIDAALKCQIYNMSDEIPNRTLMPGNIVTLRGVLGFSESDTLLIVSSVIPPYGTSEI